MNSYKHNTNILKFCFLTVVLFICFSCTKSSRNKYPDISHIDVHLRLDRFEQDLFAIDTVQFEAGLAKLAHKYDGFFDCFINDIIRISSLPGSDSLPLKMKRLLQIGGFRASYDSVETEFVDIEFLKNGLEKAFRYQQYYFPEINVPRVVTFVSEFAYGITLCNDSTIGIGLDLFLGSDCPIYPSLYIPQYVIEKLEADYIVPTVIKSWLTAEFGKDPGSVNLLAGMVERGKLLYATKMMLPDAGDATIVGYTEPQLTWCLNNEGEIWAYFKGEHALYETSMQKNYPYLNEGPTTMGMPPESPGNIGSWVGWRIVDAYMEKNDEISLADLMRETNAQKILELSGYKPKRN